MRLFTLLAVLVFLSTSLGCDEGLRTPQQKMMKHHGEEDQHPMNIRGHSRWQTSDTTNIIRITSKAGANYQVIEVPPRTHGNLVLQINVYNGDDSLPHIASHVADDESGVGLGAVVPHVYQGVDGSIPLEWWQTAVVYQVYPRSFKDSSASGTGDLRGILSKVDYLQSLGVGAVWLSPIYKSPMADFGYDVSDFRDVDPTFGTLEDLDALIQELHARGIKLIMDFIPNHSSDQHPWFLNSVRKIDPHTHYYVWADPSGYDDNGAPQPPNNWLSVFGGSAWEWSETRKQFYLHQFLKEQPDLNVRNFAVLNELEDLFKFWFARGVDGFRIDAIRHMFETEDLGQDEPRSFDPKVKDPLQYGFLEHNLTVDQPETLQVVRQWRTLFDQYPHKLMMTEAYNRDVQELMKYYSWGAHFPFNFFFIDRFKGRDDFTAPRVKEVIDLWMGNMPQGAWPNWVLGNHDNSRVATRLGADLVDALNMLVLLLPGTPTTYYGEEIGMVDRPVSYEETRDTFGLKHGPDRYQEFSRDPERTPMQWYNTAHAGFSVAEKTWLPVHDNYTPLNVRAQMDDVTSHLKVYQALTKLRQEDAFQRGSLSFPVVTQSVLGFERTCGEDSYLVLINTSRKPSRLPHGLVGQVILRSSFDTRNETEEKSKVRVSDTTLLGGEGLVLRLES